MRIIKGSVAVKKVFFEYFFIPSEFNPTIWKFFRQYLFYKVEIAIASVVGTTLNDRVFK